MHAIRTSLSSEDRIHSAAQRLAAASDSSSLDLLLTSFERVLANPHSERYRKVNLSNPTFRKVSSTPGAMELMHATGFEPHYGHLLLNNYDARLLTSAVEALKAARSNPAYTLDAARVQASQARTRQTREAERLESMRREEFARKVPAEPAEGGTGVAKVCIHLSDGSHVWRRFESWDTLKDLLNFVQSLPNTPGSPHLENITCRPGAKLDPSTQLGHTIHSLDLWPCGHIRVSCEA